ncbi:MAG TPA: hypothetical protein VFO78_12710 [Candidatus Limnocylindrales bacterium]|nr:hypothetical protein [Candidatus Limnocylindrales bacterium]
MAPQKPAREDSLRRLGGGRWQTRDERFTIEPQSGTWSLVDGEQTDELGLPLVRGPFRSLTEAKAAIEEARSSSVQSPLGERLKAARDTSPSAPSGSGSARQSVKSAGGGSRRKKAAKEPKNRPEPSEPPEAPRPEVPEGLSVERVWIVEAPYTRDAAKRRAAVRYEHLERVGRLLSEGRLIEAGGYLDFTSAILFVRAESAEDALALVRDDVYLRSGVWREPIRAREYGRVVVEAEGAGTGRRTTRSRGG